MHSKIRYGKYSAKCVKHSLNGEVIKSTNNSFSVGNNEERSMSLYTEGYETAQLWVIITTDCPTLTLFMNV